MLALQGPQYSLNESISIAGHTVIVSRTSEVEGTGGSIWDAEMILTRYLHSTIDLTSKTVLELGAGLGLLSIFCKKFGAERVISTDLPECLPNIRDNAVRNHVDIEVQELNWQRGEVIHADVILGADIVWVKEIVPHLAYQLGKLKNDRSIILLCNKIRSNMVHDYFLAQLDLHNLAYSIIHQENNHHIAEILFK